MSSQILSGFVVLTITNAVALIPFNMLSPNPTPVSSCWRGAGEPEAGAGQAGGTCGPCGVRFPARAHLSAPHLRRTQSSFRRRAGRLLAASPGCKGVRNVSFLSEAICSGRNRSGGGHGICGVTERKRTPRRGGRNSWAAVSPLFVLSLLGPGPVDASHSRSHTYDLYTEDYARCHRIQECCNSQELHDGVVWTVPAGKLHVSPPATWNERPFLV